MQLKLCNEINISNNKDFAAFFAKRIYADYAGFFIRNATSGNTLSYAPTADSVTVLHFLAVARLTIVKVKNTENTNPLSKAFKVIV